MRTVWTGRAVERVSACWMGCSCSLLSAQARSCRPRDAGWGACICVASCVSVFARAPPYNCSPFKKPNAQL